MTDNLDKDQDSLFFEDTTGSINPWQPLGPAVYCRQPLLGSGKLTSARPGAENPPMSTAPLDGGLESSSGFRPLPVWDENEIGWVLYPELKESVVYLDLNESDNLAKQPASHSNLYTVLEGVDMDGCTRSGSLRKRAITLVRWYKNLKLPYERDLPALIECGGLRAAVRQCFSAVSEQWELSFKTIQKIEQNCCERCKPRFAQRLSQWKEQRFQPVVVDDDHLQKFKRAFRGNVDKGWDERRRPFIPNGNATLTHKRKDAGNWNKEPFSEDCRVALVFSSGKPRVVTLYSAGNTEILAPLHYSLYENLQRKGWLLVGEPTSEDIGRLAGTRYLSFDYQSATDMIKTAYVEAAVEILIEKASSLSDDEIRALRVLSNLCIDGEA